MPYHACPPPPALLPYVDAYWESVHDGTPRPGPRILPDGCLDVVLNLGTPWPTAPAGLELPVGRLMLIGTLTRPVSLVPMGPARTFGIRFRPAGLARFLAGPVPSVPDGILEVAAFAPALARQLLGHGLPDAATFAGQCRAASQALLKLLIHVPAPEPRLWHAAQQLQATAGRLSVQQAADLACLSVRQFERRYLALTGLPPKQVAELLRFRAVCQQLRAAPAAPLDALAFATGYYDAAHLSRAFGRYAGQTPASYRH